jgi:hypothetical protein
MVFIEEQDQSTKTGQWKLSVRHGMWNKVRWGRVWTETRAMIGALNFLL